MSDLVRAIRIAREAHQGQIDRKGIPVLAHVERVSAMGTTEWEEIVGALHDVCEDTTVTLDDLAAAGFDCTVCDAVDALTRRDGETYADYIERVATDRLATRVKLNDLADNVERGRNDPSCASLLNRYAKAQTRLLSAVAVEPEGGAP